MKKISFFSLQKLRKWIVPLVGAGLMAFTLLAWEGLEKATTMAEERYFYGAYEKMDRCLTAYYNNDPEAFLAQFPDYVMAWSEKNTNLTAEVLREQVKNSMQAQYEQRQQTGATYEWEYVRWDSTMTDMDFAVLSAIGMKNMIGHIRVYRPIEIKVKETIGGKTTETVVRYVMCEKNEEWYTDLLNTSWLGESVVPVAGMAPYKAVSDWLNAWYTGIYSAVLEKIPEAVIDAKTDTDRKAWEKALLIYLANQSAKDRENGTTYNWVMDELENLPDAEFQKLQQEYKDTCGLEITDARSMECTTWATTPSKDHLGIPTVVQTTINCTTVEIDGQWYMDSLHLPTGLPDLWKIKAE